MVDGRWLTVDGDIYKYFRIKSNLTQQYKGLSHKNKIAGFPHENRRYERRAYSEIKF